MPSRETNELLEALQAENRSLSRDASAARAEVERLTAELQRLTALYDAARLENDRLAGLLAGQALNPQGQTSAFGVEQVARLMAYLKSS